MSEQEVKTTEENTEETPVETTEETPVENKSLEYRVEELENKLSKLVDILNSCYFVKKFKPSNNLRWNGNLMIHKKSDMDAL
tara:strand:+ start:202 stop:447 length:246 start_codon:yes stop_codon:yes gene_type:complete